MNRITYTSATSGQIIITDKPVGIETERFIAWIQGNGARCIAVDQYPASVAPVSFIGGAL
jgi:hypothetical protein